MSNQSYYEILGVAPSAAVTEIETAYEDHYNKWRRLVTHHDPNVVTQANQALQTLEQIRTTLTAPDKRAAYDAGIGVGGAVGGLGDPDAVTSVLHQAGLLSRSMSPPTGARARSVTGQRIDAWICPKCQTANAVGKLFCTECGQSIGRECPNCGQTIESRAEFCSECGVDVQATARAKQEAVEEAAHARALEEQRQAALRRQETEQQVALEPIMKRSNEAWSWTKAGCICYFIPLVGLISVPAWIGAVIKAQQALNLSQTPGDAEHRAQAKKALLWSLIPLIITCIFVLIYVTANVKLCD